MNRLNLKSAIVAGALATLAMTALMYAAPLMGLPAMDLLGALGGMLPIGLPPYLLGAAMHLGIGVTLAVLYALAFERFLPGPRWLRGAAFSLLPWLFAVTLMGPAMAWLQQTVGTAEARVLGNAGAARSATVNPCAARNPCAAANPCAAPTQRPANPCAAVNPCAAANSAAAAASPWVLRLMSLVAHIVFGAVLATVYRPRAADQDHVV